MSEEKLKLVSVKLELLVNYVGSKINESGSLGSDESCNVLEVLRECQTQLEEARE